MSDAGAIRAGKAFVEITTKDAAFRKGLLSAQALLRTFGRAAASVNAGLQATASVATSSGTAIRGVGLSILGVAGTAGAGLLGLTHLFTEMGAAVDDASARTGVGIEEIQSLGYAAQQSGSDAATLEAGLLKLEKTVGAAADGATGATEALDRLGFSAEQLQALSPDEQFRQIADRLAAIEDPAEKAHAAMAIFGRGGAQLLPMLNQGSAGIRALEAEAHQFGLVMGKEQVEAAGKFEAATDRLWSVLKMLGANIGGTLIDELTGFVEWVTKAAVAVSQWIKDNQQLIVTAAQVIGVVAAVGAGLVAIGTILAGAGMMLAGIIAGISAAAGVITAVVAAALSPLGLLVIGIAAIAAAFIDIPAAAGEAFSWLTETLGALTADVMATWQGISDAIAAGDLTLAMQIAWQGIQVVWQKGLAWINQQWQGWKTFFLEVANEAVSSLSEVLINCWSLVRLGWAATVSFLKTAWAEFCSFVQAKWNVAQDFVTDSTLEVWSYFDSDMAAMKDQVQGILDQDRVTRDRGINQANSDRRKAADESWINDIKTISGDRNQMLAGTTAAKDAERERIRKAEADSIAASEQAIRDAQAAWQQSIDAAAAKRRQVEEGAVEAARQRLPKKEDVDQAVEKVTKQTSAGVFNAEAVRSLNVGVDPQKETAKNTKKTVESLAKIDRKIQNGGLVFG